MVESAKARLVVSGIDTKNINLYEVAGCFEIPLIGSVLAKEGQVDALMGLGIVVQGETMHAQAIVQQSARGMMNIQIGHQIPFAFEVLHVDSLKDAQDRAKLKGCEASIAVISSLLKLRSIIHSK